MFRTTHSVRLVDSRRRGSPSDSIVCDWKHSSRHLYLPILRYIINYNIIVFNCTHSRERVTETKSSCWKTGVHWSKHPSQDEVQSHRSNSEVAFFPVHLARGTDKAAYPVSSGFSSSSVRTSSGYTSLQLQLGGPNRTRRRQAPLRRSRGEYFMKSPSLIVGKLVAPFSVQVFWSHSFFAIIRFCDFHSFSYQDFELESCNLYNNKSKKIRTQKISI